MADVFLDMSASRPTRACSEQAVMNSAWLTSGPPNTFKARFARAVTSELRKIQSVKSFCRAVINFESFNGESMAPKRAEKKEDPQRHQKPDAHFFIGGK